VSWLVIIISVALQLYFIRTTREAVEEQRETESQGEEPWFTYTLSDGSIIKVKHKLKSAKRLEKYSPDGIPVYVVDYDNIVQVVSVPERLTKKTKE
jgi:endo-alpha-1,4-polygalactosaminidase (GH114 family)